MKKKERKQYKTTLKVTHMYSQSSCYNFLSSQKCSANIQQYHAVLGS